MNLQNLRFNALVSAIPLLVIVAATTEGASDAAWREYRFPSAPRRVVGVRWQANELSAPMPLGGIGTGTIYFDSQTRFSGMTLTNSYRPVGGMMKNTGFALIAYDKDGGRREIPFEKTAKNCIGHFPILDVEGDGADLPVRWDLRVFAPFVLGDARLSATPAAFFRVRLRNTGPNALTAGVRFRWNTPAMEEGIDGRSATGNVDGFLAWDLGDLASGTAVEQTVLMVSAASTTALKKKLANPRGNISVDEDGAFNWEDTRRQCLDTPDGPCLSQHGFYLWYQRSDSRKHRVGTRITGGTRLENLKLLAHGPNSTRLHTADGILEVRIESGPGRLKYSVRNLGKTPVRGLRLAVYANLEAAHTESNDYGALDPDLDAVVIADPAGPACALVGVGRSPVGGWVGLWGKTIPRMRSGKFLPRDEWTAPDTASKRWRTTTRSTGAVQYMTSEQRSDCGGCTVAAVPAPGITVHPLPNDPRNPQHIIGAEAVVQLAPDEERTLRFVLTWYYPDARDSTGRFVGHQYANWFADSAAVAEFAAPRFDTIQKEVGDWQERIYASKAPGWLDDVAINSLALLARNSAWIKDGRFTMSESFVGCPITETIVCRFYGSVATAMFFPELEKNTMRQFMRHQRKGGAIPFAFGGRECWDSPYYETQKILDSSEFVIMAHRNATWWNDLDWAAECYPAVRRAIEFARTLDTDGDGLINDELSRQYYDCWQMYGAGSYTSGIWLAALRAAAALARTVDDQAFARQCDEGYGKALASFEEKLWTGTYYRLWNDSAHARSNDTCLAAQLTGQWAAFQSDLGWIVPKEHGIQALRHIDRVNGAGAVWALVNGITPDGKRDRTGSNGHSDSATLGETWCFAAMAIHAGMSELALRRARRLAENIALVQRRPWSMTWNMDPDTGRYLWGREYYSNLCVWDLWATLAGVRALP